MFLFCLLVYHFLKKVLLDLSLSFYSAHMDTLSCVLGAFSCCCVYLCVYSVSFFLSLSLSLSIVVVVVVCSSGAAVVVVVVVAAAAIGSTDGFIVVPHAIVTDGPVRIDFHTGAVGLVSLELTLVPSSVGPHALSVSPKHVVVPIPLVVPTLGKVATALALSGPVFKGAGVFAAVGKAESALSVSFVVTELALVLPAGRLPHVVTVSVPLVLPKLSLVDIAVAVHELAPAVPATLYPMTLVGTLHTLRVLHHTVPVGHVALARQSTRVQTKVAVGVHHGTTVHTVRRGLALVVVVVVTVVIVIGIVVVVLFVVVDSLEGCSGGRTRSAVNGADRYHPATTRVALGGSRDGMVVQCLGDTRGGRGYRQLP